MYARSAKSSRYASRARQARPLILCEYAHAMGNSIGNLAGLLGRHRVAPAVARRVHLGLGRPGAQQASTQRRRNDLLCLWRRLRRPANDGNFCINGLVQPDRVPNPHLWEVKKVYQNVKVVPIDASNKRFRVTNRFGFTNLNQFECDWTLRADGLEVERGSLGRLDVAQDRPPRSLNRQQTAERESAY